jgi:hypothetical protein
MKKFILILFVILSATLFVPAVFAQPPEAEATLTEAGPGAFDLTTFAGIVAVVSLIVTQLAKNIPYIGANTLLKIFCSLAVGTGVTLLAWWLQTADFLNDLTWWQALIEGVLSGGAACGLYDLLKSLLTAKST